MALSGDALQEFRPETVRGTVGFFRVGQRRDGFWSLLDPEGREFFARAVSEVDEGEGGPAKASPMERLRTWKFNTIGPGSAPGLPTVTVGAGIGVVDFCAAGPVIHAGGARLPDVFDPGWNETVAEAAARCAVESGRRDLLGWLADDGLDWAQPVTGDGRPTLLQICLSLEPNHAAYHAAWEFVLAPHAGQLAQMARAWSVPLGNKEMLREWTRAEQGLATRGYLRDLARWTRECAERYFATTSAAIRAQDPHHLLLGARSRRPMGSAALEVAAAAVDLPWTRWTELGAVRTGPVLAGDFSWASEAFFGGPATVRAPGQTSVERMLRRGRAALRRLVMQPAVVGYAWRQWRDGMGEQPPFANGLVHVNGVEAREHTELVADINGKTSILRASPSALFASS